MDGTAHKREKRLVIDYQGRVQGVGFRFTANELAGRHKVKGFVRNEWDGSVHLEAEGQVRDVEAFAAALSASRLGRYIHGAQRRWTEATGEFTTFEIRHTR